jgi:hypothetical protein
MTFKGVDAHTFARHESQVVQQAVAARTGLTGGITPSVSFDWLILTPEVTYLRLQRVSTEADQEMSASFCPLL